MSVKPKIKQNKKEITKNFHLDFQDNLTGFDEIGFNGSVVING